MIGCSLLFRTKRLEPISLLSFLSLRLRHLPLKKVTQARRDPQELALLAQQELTVLLAPRVLVLKVLPVLPVLA